MMGGMMEPKVAAVMQKSIGKLNQSVSSAITKLGDK